MQPCSREMQGLNSLFNSNSHLDPSNSNDDFLKQILSSLPSSSWTLNPNSHQTPSDHVVFPYDEQTNLTSKFQNHQISDKASALMLQHQLLMSSANSGLLHMPFDPSPNDVVDGSSFKSPTPAGEGSVQALYNGSLQAPLQHSNSNQTQQHFQHPHQGQSFGASAPSGGGASGQLKQRVRARRGQATDPHSIAERLRRERIAERMKALQELVPNANKFWIGM